jgi:KDO2-lipid IV(A) lauroyltransferase
MMKRKLNYLLYLFLRLLAAIPIGFYYLLTPIVYFLVYYIFEYRKSVVFNNLRNSFPEKSEKEISWIAKQFYRHLVDMIFEIIKLFHYKEPQISKRFIFKNVEIFEDDRNKGRSAILVSSHYNNWEMMVGPCEQFNFSRIIIYHPLKNKFLDEIFVKNRSKTGSELVPMNNFLRRLLDYNKNKIQTLSWIIADQTPPPETAYWTTFLNQDTPFFLGAEKTARKFNLPVYYMHMQKLKRGHYAAVFSKLFDNTRDEPEFAITEAIVKKMEEEIIEAPQFWLWSHRRWKHKRPDGM